MSFGMAVLNRPENIGEWRLDLKSLNQKFLDGLQWTKYGHYSVHIMFIKQVR